MDKNKPNPDYVDAPYEVSGWLHSKVFGDQTVHIKETGVGTRKFDIFLNGIEVTDGSRRLALLRAFVPQHILQTC